jgi:predicted nucleic acid-binding protein
MGAKVFIDTNVLIYAHDVEAGRKHAIAAGILTTLWASQDGALSTQVLQEFYVNVTRKIPKPLPRATAREVIRTYAAWHLEQVDMSHIIVASEIEERDHLSFWDALIIAAARRAGATTILSEDLNAGQQFGSVRIENPFARIS